MEEKTSDKKKIRLYVIIGVGLLSFFIIVRLIVRSQDNGQLTEIKALDYKDVKLPEEKTKEERWEEEESKEFNSEMSGEKYVGTNFKDILKKTAGDKKVVEEEKLIQQEPLFTTTPNKTTKVDNYYESDNQNLDAVINKISKSKKQGESKEQHIEVSEPVSKQPLNNGGGDEMFGTNKKSASNTTSKKIGTNFKAQIYGRHSISDGGGVVIRLLESMVLDGVSLPKNTLLYGKGNYSGNRVKITLNKAKTPGGEIPIRIKVFDNDRIEGIAYKAPIDEVVEKQQDETDVNIGTQYDGIINKGVKSVVKGTKELIQKSRTLKLDDGYVVFLEQIEGNNY